MKIAILGWYHEHNAGDDRIGYCLQRFFEDRGHTVVLLPVHNLSSYAQLHTYDYVLLGGGGIILRRSHIIAQRLQKYVPHSVRLGVVGVSVESAHKTARALGDFLKSRADFIVVRDRSSARLLGNHYKVIVTSDMSFLYPYDIVKHPEKNVSSGVNMRAWPYWHGEYGSLWFRTMKYLDAAIPYMRYIYVYKKYSAQKHADVLLENLKAICPVSLYNKHVQSKQYGEYENDSTCMKKFFSHVPDTFLEHDMTRCSMHVGMRLHYILFAIQMGIPCINVCYQPKNYAILQDASLSDVCIDITAIHTLPEKIAYVRHEYMHIRERMLSYRAYAHAHVHETMTKVAELMETYQK